MAQQLINIGLEPNDKSGDLIRTAFDKVNQNFTELYSTTATASDRLVNGDAELVLNVNGVTPYVEFPAVEGANIVLQGSEVISFGSAIAVGSFNDNVLITANAQGPTQQWTFDTNGGLTLPSIGNLKQNNSYIKTVNSPSVASNVSTIVWSSENANTSSAKLLIQVECNEVGDSTGWHAQSCEAIIAARAASNTGPVGDPSMTIYGVTHTSVSPLVTFTIQRNVTTNFIEVVALTTLAADGIAYIKIHSTEMTTRD